MRITAAISTLTALGSLTLIGSAQTDAFCVESSSGDLVRFSLQNPANNVTVGNYASNVEGLEFGPGGVLYALRNNGDLDVVNPANAASANVGTMTAVGGHIWTGLAFDSTTGTMYSSSTTGNTESALYTVNLSNGTATLVGTTNLAEAVVDIAVDPAGTMYAHDIDGNQIHTLDKATGAATPIGGTGFVATLPWHGLDCQPDTGALFMISHNGISNDNELRSVDTSTGLATPIGSMGLPASSIAIRGSGAVVYCTPGSSAGGCRALLSSSGTPSATASSGFSVLATAVEGAKDGLYFFGANGRQANPWGNGSSYQCVAPPVKRAGLLVGIGTVGSCDGAFSQDLNARWTAQPAQNPGAGAVVQAQLWYRDPFNTSNQTTSLSNAIEFTVAP